MEELFTQKIFKDKNIFIFGLNAYTELIDNLLCMEGYEVCGIIDNDKEKQRKTIHGIVVLSPEDIAWEENNLILIASRHAQSMITQLHMLSEGVEIAVLIDLAAYIEEDENVLFIEESFESKVQELYQGADIYNRLDKGNYLIIFPTSSIGDMFLSCLYLPECIKGEEENAEIISMSKAALEIGNYFLGIESIKLISTREMSLLVKYIDYGVENTRVILCDYMHMFYHMAMYKNIPTRCIASYIFRLKGGYQRHFPSIWDSRLDVTLLEEKGLLKGKSVILAPYTNTVRPLPFRFWTVLAERLTEMKYKVFTNIVGKQKPVKGSQSIEIPLHQIGNYLEYAGFFVALRSGLCDIAGRSRCRQIIFFRDEIVAFQRLQIECFDLHIENISENAIQYVYDDSDLYGNVDKVLENLLVK